MSLGSRRLTLFIPGLLQPPVAVDPDRWAGLLQLKNLETLLTRGDAVEPPGGDGGPETPLFQLFGFAPDPEQGPPVAAVTRYLDTGMRDDGWYLRVDPVHLRADLDKLILFDARSFALGEEEARALASEVRDLLAGTGGEFLVPLPSRWYLRLPEPAGIHTRSLAEVSGRDLRDCLPSGDRAREWRRLLNEIQMVLYASPVNRAREDRGEPTVNSVWFWGGGSLPASVEKRWDQTWSDDPVAEGLAQLTGTVAGGLPADGGSWLGSAETGSKHLVFVDSLREKVRHRDMEGWLEQLQDLEGRWFRPLLEGLRKGQLESLILVDDGRVGRCATKRSIARWWRRTRPFRDYIAGENNQ